MNEKEARREGVGESDFSLHAEVWLDTDLFFYRWKNFKKNKKNKRNCCWGGMKVNNMHEFVKKINNAAFRL